MSSVDAWVWNGRIAVKTATDSWHANLDWQHLVGNDQLHLSGPFGQGGVRILVQPGSIQITDAKGNSEASDWPERMLHRRFGFAVPLSALRYWILGLEEPGSTNTIEFDSNGFLRKIVYQAWEVQITKYMFSNGYTIPRKIQIKREDMILKLIVDHWRQGG